MPIKPQRKLFVIIQPLQYLQALELKKCTDHNILIALWANKDSQLHSLIKKELWDKIIWVDYRGTVVDILKNQKSIRRIINELGDIDELILSAYYNELMNLIANKYPNSNKILLEDGVANLLIDQSEIYHSKKFKLKSFVCKLFNFNVKPLDQVDIFTIFQPGTNKIPKIAKKVIINEFSKLKKESLTYIKNDAIYFVSTGFISAGMLSKDSYINFLIRLATDHRDKAFNIILHRFDRLSDFTEVEKLDNVNVIESKGPIELFFKTNRVLPHKLITAGSGATETLNLIYKMDIEVVFPKLKYFPIKFKAEMEVLAEHFKENYPVKFL